MSDTSVRLEPHRNGAIGPPHPCPAFASTRLDRARSGVELVNLFDVAVTSHRCVAPLRQWATEYLTRPHPDLGRPGPVCPFTGPSIARGLFWVGFVDGADVDAEQVSRAVAEVHRAFPSLPPVEGEESLLKAVLLVFPDLSDYSIIEEVQNHGKSKFVKEGLMLGQFYPGCTAPGLRNAAFPALDSPVPILAVRQMVGSDFPFLTTRAEWIDAYLRKFAPDVPTHVRSEITDTLVTPEGGRR